MDDDGRRTKADIISKQGIDCVTLFNFLTDDYPQFIGEILLPLCSEFKLAHHCHWKNYSKSCTNHIMDYLELMNHSCHDLFGESHCKTSENSDSITI